MADQSKSDLSAARTDYAEDRTLLANERTFASWVRTGYAAVGVGLGFQALFNRLQPEWLPRAIATIFFVSAILIFLASERRACAVLARLESHAVRTAGQRQMRLLAYLSAAACTALTIVIWRSALGSVF
jgi:putative membrane protein